MLVECDLENGDFIAEITKQQLELLIALIYKKSNFKITNVQTDYDCEEIDKLEDNIENLEYQLESRDVEVKELKEKIEELELEKEIEEKNDKIYELEVNSIPKYL